jgi:hypothetical protein
MIEQEEPGRDLAGLAVPLAGRLVATGDRWEPYRLVDAGGVSVPAAGAYFGHLQAAGRSELTIRSYGLDLLRSLVPVLVGYRRAVESRGP